MRILFILMVRFLLSCAFATAQQLPEQQEHQERPKVNCCPQDQTGKGYQTDNRSNATINIQLPSEKQQSEPQENPTKEGDDSWAAWTAWGTGIIALFTIILAGVGYLQWRTYQATLDTIQVKERAYLSASPRSPQGAIIEVKIKNYGETPATITALAIECVATLPREITDIGEAQDFAGHYLVKTEWFFWRVMIPDALKSTSYFLVGYIDYETEFKKRRWLISWRWKDEKYRRLSFAREYNPGEGVFMFIAKGGYNWDHPRKPGKE